MTKKKKIQRANSISACVRRPNDVEGSTTKSCGYGWPADKTDGIRWPRTTYSAAACAVSVRAGVCVCMPCDQARVADLRRCFSLHRPAPQRDHRPPPTLAMKFDCCDRLLVVRFRTTAWTSGVFRESFFFFFLSNPGFRRRHHLGRCA